MTGTRRVIAIDIKGSEEYQNFIYEVFRIITAQHLQHIFIFIFDKPYDCTLIFSENVIPLVVSKTKGSLLSQLKVKSKISSLLKKYKADVFLTSQTLSHIKVPQCLIAWEIFSSKYLKKAQVIVADSDFFKKEIIEKYKVDAIKIDVVYKGVEEIFHPLGFAEKKIIKEKYANGNEYFLFTGIIESESNLLNLLKAFSIFKKKQKSNMQLLIASKDEISKEFLKSLQLFKFKSEVKILEKIHKKELAKITGAAYAFLYPFAQAYSQILQAMSYGVPIITGNKGDMPEICGDAVLYIHFLDHKEIADKMILIYKDEILRQQLVEKGKEQVKKYSWDDNANLLWKSIEKAYR